MKKLTKPQLDDPHIGTSQAEARRAARAQSALVMRLIGSARGCSALSLDPQPLEHIGRRGSFVQPAAS